IPSLGQSLDATYRQGTDPRSLVESMLHRLSDLTRAYYGVESGSATDSTQEAAMKAVSLQFGIDNILSWRGALAAAHSEIRQVTIPKVWLEAELIRMAIAVPTAQAVATVVSTPVAAAKQPGQPKGVPVQPVAVAESSQVEPTADPALNDARSKWANLVNELGSSSAVARERLTKTQVHRIEGNKAMIRLASQMALELVQGSKLEKGIREKWRNMGSELEISFFFETRRMTAPPAVEETAVELPAEGDRLVALVHEVLGVASNTNETS
ncbi:MAG: hypothetical protein JNM34_11875, partial [Chthonomonadaceae bacterium]|nr:hypothetical protein [Chthonomonadaceae bacterium]